MDDAPQAEGRARAYSALVARKKTCRDCPSLVNPAYHSGRDFDQGQIGLWTRWQGALDAPLMVVGQDWGGVDTLARNDGWEDDPFPTNDALRRLMAEIGLAVEKPPLNRHSGAVPQNQVAFFTNAVLCLKAGGAPAKLPKSAVVRCGGFLHDTIEIVRPKIVVTLGKPAFSSVVRSYKDVLPARSGKQSHCGNGRFASRPARNLARHAAFPGLPLRQPRADAAQRASP